MKPYYITLLASSISLGLGIYLGNFQKDLANLGFAASGVFAGGAVVTSIANGKIDKLKTDLERLQSSIKELEEGRNNLKLKLATSSGDFKSASSTVQNLKTTNAQLCVEVNNLRNSNNKLTADNGELDKRVRELISKVEKIGQQCIEQEEELNQHATDFEEKVKVEVEKIVTQKVDEISKTIIKKELEDEFRLNQEAVEIMEAQQKLMEDIYQRHQSQRHQLLSTNDTYKQHFESTVQAKNNAYNELVVEKAQLEAQLSAARQVNAGELLAPGLIRDKQGKQFNIANYIANELWEAYQIPLKLHGVVETENGFRAGYGYSVTANREQIAECIDKSREYWRDLKGIYQINQPYLPKHLPVIEVGFIIDRPPVLKDDEIYRFLEKSTAFGQIIRDAQNHRKGGKPTLRIMSGTGGGKSLVGKIIIQEYCDRENDYEIRLSDPLHGSDQDYWNCPKVATDKKTAHKAFLDYANEHKARSNKTSANKSQKILGMFDEFDKQHPQEDKTLAAEIWTAIRHNKMRLILFGQSGEVGKTGWTWDEMNNCSMLFLGDGIATAIKHYKDIGFSVKYKNQLQRQYEQIKDWLKSKNDGLDSAKEYRVALLVIGQEARFLELPPAQIEPVSNNKSWVVSTPFQGVAEHKAESAVTDIPKVKPVCPDCGTVSNTPLGKSGRYKCLNNDCSRKTFTYKG